MNELDDIKARAKERRSGVAWDDESEYGLWREAEADLDHALAIAEDWKNEYEAANDDSEQYRSEVGRLLQERDEARDNINLLREREQYLARELVQTRAAVLQLRAGILDVNDDPNWSGWFNRLLADTESYEQYR